MLSRVSTILFVCVHNAGRSQMAEALCNTMAHDRGVDCTCRSAGTIPGGHLNPRAVAVMAELGIDLRGHAPKLLTPELLTGADRTITMGCGVDTDACPAGFLLSEDWRLDDPAGQPIEAVRRIRDAVTSRVTTLLDELEEAQR